MRAGETLRFYISNVSLWIEHITITKALKCMFCDVPPLDLSRNVDIKPQGVLTWISESSPTAKIGQFFHIYVAENEIMCWCYLTPFMFICSDAYRYVYLNPYRECYTNIYRVIGVILLVISWEIYRVGDNRRTTEKCQYVDSPHISDQLGTENAW